MRLSSPLKFFCIRIARSLFICVSVFLLLSPGSLYAQQIDSIYVINNPQKSIRLSRIYSAMVSANINLEDDYHDSLISKHKLIKGSISPGNVSKKLITKFSVYNPKDETDTLCFFPGFFFKNAILHELKNQHLKSLPILAPKIDDSISFRMFTVKANDTATFIAESYMEKTYANLYDPHIFDIHLIDTFSFKLYDYKKNVSLFTYVFCGLLLMMILFSLANFLLVGNKDFLFYAVYAILLASMLFTKQYYFKRSNAINFFFEVYMDFFLQALSICFFLAFMIRFLETKRNFPFLHRLYMTGIFFLPVVMVIYTIIHFSSIDYYWENLLENVITKMILLAMMVILLIYAVYNWHHKLLRYIFWGNLIYLLFAIFSLILVLNSNAFKLPGIFSDSLVLYELGLFGELTFFLMGLVYKNRTQLIEQIQERERLKSENDRKEFEKQMAVMQAHQEERERISADIHDELGSGMTTIRLMSEIAKNKMKGNIPVEIEKISNSSNEVLNKMNAIIWSMNSSNDTLDSLISYIRAYAIEFFDATSIDCHVNMPQQIPHKEISGDKRRNIFLCVKESLNNILKHSKASKLQIDIETDDNIQIRIKDNGIGIEPEKIRRFGNGLKNIERRMKSIGGEYKITGENGTTTLLLLPV